MLVGIARTIRWRKHVGGDAPSMVGVRRVSAICLAIAGGIGLYIALG